MSEPLRPATLLKKRLWHKFFPVNFAKFLRAPFLKKTRPVAASVVRRNKNAKKMKTRESKERKFEKKSTVEVGRW